MPRPVAFEQDEDQEYGTGWFRYDDGSKARYGSHPDLARELVVRGQAAPPPAPVGARVPPPAEVRAAEGTEGAEGAEDGPGEPSPPEPDATPGPGAKPPQAGAGAPDEANGARPPRGLAPSGYQTQRSGSRSTQSSQSRTVSGRLPGEMVSEQHRELEDKKTKLLEAQDDYRFSAASAMANQAAEAEQRGREREIEGAAAQKQMLDRQERAKQMSKRVSETPIRPRRAWEDAPAFNRVLGSLAVGLGGFADRMLGKQNGALENIRSAMAEDTKAQLANRDSQIAYWSRELGSAEAGVAAADLKRWQGVQMQLDAHLKDEKSQEVLARGAVLEQQIDLEITQAQQALVREGYGQEVLSDSMAQTAGETTSEGTNYARPTPTGGAPSAEQLLQQIKLQNALLDQADAEDVGRAIGARVSPETANRLRGQAKEVGEKIAPLDGAMQMTRAVLEAAGAKLNDETGEIEWPDDLAGVGFADTFWREPGQKPGLVRTDYDRVNDARRGLKEYIAKYLTGAAYSPIQDETFKVMAGGERLRNEDEFKDNLTNWVKNLVAEKNAQMSRLDEKAQRLYLWNKGRARDTDQSAPYPEPR